MRITEWGHLSPEIQATITEMNVEANNRVWQEPADTVWMALYEAVSPSVIQGESCVVPIKTVAFRRMRTLSEGRGRYVFESIE